MDENTRRTDLSLRACVVAAAMVSMMGMQYVSAFIVKILARYICFYDTAAEAYTLPYWVFCLVEYFFMFSVPLLILWWTNRGNVKPMLRLLAPGEGSRVLPAVAVSFPILLGSTYVMSFASDLIAGFFALFGLSEGELFGEEPVGWASWIFYILVYCVAAPVCEELFFRGAVLNMLKPYGDLFAILSQAVMFSVFHRTVTQMPYTLVGGLLFGYLAVRFGGILPTVLLHALNNGFSLLISPLSELFGEGEREQMFFALLIYVVFIGGGLLLTGLWARRDPTLFKVGTGEAEEMKVPSAFRTFFAHPAMVLLYILSAYEMISYMV